MKIHKLIAIGCTSICFALLVGCSDPSNVQDVPPPRYYNLKIYIQDKDGNDLIEGIKHYEDPQPATVEYEVVSLYYQLHINQPQKPKEKLHVAPLYVGVNEENNYLVITTLTMALNSEYRPDNMEHTLVCYSVFGDSEKHTLISNWELGEPLSEVCTSIVFDGKTYTRERIDHNYSVFTLVID